MGATNPKGVHPAVRKKCSQCSHICSQLGPRTVLAIREKALVVAHSKRFHRQYTSMVRGSDLFSCPRTLPRPFRPPVCNLPYPLASLEWAERKHREECRVHAPFKLLQQCGSPVQPIFLQQCGPLPPVCGSFIHGSTVQQTFHPNMCPAMISLVPVP